MHMLSGQGLNENKFSSTHLPSSYPQPFQLIFISIVRVAIIQSFTLHSQFTIDVDGEKVCSVSRMGEMVETYVL
jgi:hypothetical protein